MQDPDVDCLEQLFFISEAFVADFEKGDAVACADAYTADAIIVTGSEVVGGRDGIVAYLRSLFERGYRLWQYTTSFCQCEGRTAWAIQTVHSNDGDSDVLLGLRRDDDGIWYIDAEMSLGNPAGHEARILFAEPAG